MCVVRRASACGAVLAELASTASATWANASHFPPLAPSWRACAGQSRAAATAEMAWLNPFAANPTRPVLPAPSPGVRTRVGEPNILNNNVFARPAPATPRPEPKRARGAAPTPLSRRLVLHETPDRPLDEIEESDGEGDPDLRLADSPSTPLPPAPGQMPGQCFTPMPASTSGARTNPALAPPPSRSALVSGLQLSEAHLGEALDSSARRTGSRRAGLFGACVVRAQADQETKVITARHGILRPSLASADAVRGALADPSLERLRLRLRRVLAPAPLVYLECEQLAEEGEHRSATRYVMLRREKFDAVCQNGNAAFVVFPPWHEVGGIVLARNCEQDPTTETAVDAAALMDPTRPAAQASPTSPLGSAGGWQPT